MSNKKTLYERLESSIISGQSGIWIRSHDPDEAYSTLWRLVKDHEKEWQLHVFDCIRGLKGTDVVGTEKTGDDALNTESCISVVKTLLATAEERKKQSMLDQAEADPEKEDSNKPNILLVIRNGH